MTLRTLRVFLLAPLAALFLNIATPAYAHDGHRGYGDRYEDHSDRRDHYDRKYRGDRFHHRSQRAHRHYLRKQKRHYRKHYRKHRRHHHRAHRHYKHRQVRRPYIYFGW